MSKQKDNPLYGRFEDVVKVLVKNTSSNKKISRDRSTDVQVENKQKSSEPLLPEQNRGT